MSYWNTNTKENCRVDHDYIISADLAQTHDFTAISVIERIQYWYDPDNRDKEFFSWNEAQKEYHLRSLVRPEKGTPYPAIIKQLRSIYDSPQLKKHPKTCVIDMTGVGRPVFDQMWDSGGFKKQVYGILITGGNSVSKEGYVYHVPKKDLISALQIAFQNGEFKMAKRIDHAEQMISELNNFRYKMTSNANLQFEAWRESDHDDCVLSAAMGVWLAQQRHVKFYDKAGLWG